MSLLAQCVLTAAEDNAEAQEELRQPEVTGALVAAFRAQGDSEALLLKVVLAGQRRLTNLTIRFNRDWALYIHIYIISV